MTDATAIPTIHGVPIPETGGLRLPFDAEINGIKFKSEDVLIYNKETRSVKKIEGNNGWIPGNEPEKHGCYEITLFSGEVLVDVFSGEYWRIFKDAGIIAYKPITLSEPYKPPEPERELLCPFCDEQINRYSDSTGFYYACERDLMRLPGSNTEKEAKKLLFDIYDKLNPKEK